MLILNLSMISLLMSASMIHFSSPYMDSLLLILQTLLVAIYLSLVKSSLWFSYMLPLVYLGGMLVIFTYVSSLVSEEGFESFPVNYLIVSLILMFSTNVLFWGSSVLNGSWGGALYKDEGSSCVISELFSTDNMLMYLCVVIYLLLALICVANLMKFIAGPLRLLN
uniref:NADH-ubiquinone oxidoreductase chain 6 n=1 Tax=Idotea baltica TaxID=82763 RepID=Q19TX3_9CRUS|nr:NADH dehydrogenase subunit 6 [Idotea baltica]